TNSSGCVLTQTGIAEKIAICARTQLATSDVTAIKVIEPDDPPREIAVTKHAINGRKRARNGRQLTVNAPEIDSKSADKVPKLRIVVGTDGRSGSPLTPTPSPARGEGSTRKRWLQLCGIQRANDRRVAVPLPSPLTPQAFRRVDASTRRAVRFQA